MKNNDALINKVKVHFTLTIELVAITKKSKIPLPVQNIICKILIPLLVCPEVSKKIIFSSVSSF